MITGLGTTVDLIVAVTASYLPHGHPLVPTVRIAASGDPANITTIPLLDFDAQLASADVGTFLHLVTETLANPQHAVTSSNLQKRIQLSRGLSGISL